MRLASHLIQGLWRPLDEQTEPVFVNIKEAKNRFQEIDSARLGIDSWALKIFTNSGSGVWRKKFTTMAITSS